MCIFICYYDYFFLKKRSNRDRKAREHKQKSKREEKENATRHETTIKDILIKDDELWFLRAWRITRSYILADQLEKYLRKKEIKQFFDDGTASEEKHLSLVDRNLKQRFLFLMKNIEFYDPQMVDIVKSLACRGRTDVFRFYQPKTLNKYGLSGGLGYDPFYLEPNQVTLLDNFKIIENYFNCFNDGDFPDYNENALREHIENEIEEPIDKIFDDIKAIPENPRNFFSYLFSKDQNNFSKLTSKLDQLNEFLNDHAPPICADPTQYNFFAEGYVDDEKVNTKKLHNFGVTTEEQTRETMDIFKEIKKKLTSRRAQILDMMLENDQQVSVVAGKMNVSPAYISKEFSIIKRTILTDTNIKDLVKDLL